MQDLRGLCFDLFVAGQVFGFLSEITSIISQETTSITLTFSVLYMLLDQRVQCRMQAELDKFLADRQLEEANGQAEPELIRWADRTRLPYTTAVINASLLWLRKSNSFLTVRRYSEP